MLINLSNHPSTLWSEAQKKAAEHFGEIVDIPFPVVNPEGDEHYIYQLAAEYLEKIFDATDNQDNIIIHLMGEMTFTFALLQMLKDAGVRCVASTTERETAEHPDGLKESYFQFIQFRPYF